MKGFGSRWAVPMVVALLLSGIGSARAGDKTPPAVATEQTPDLSAAWQRRIPQFHCDGAPLDEVVKELRVKFPELNFLVKQKVRSESITVSLRSVNLQEILQAVEPATEGQVHVLWPTNEERLIIFERKDSGPRIDPSTGLPLQAGRKVCRVYNLSEYLKGMSDSELDGAIKELKDVLEQAWSMLRQANDENEPSPTLSIHRGTRLVVAVGSPEDLAVLEQVVIGLQGSAPGVPPGMPSPFGGSLPRPRSPKPTVRPSPPAEPPHN